MAELASKSPADLTKLFEEVSGSGELKPEYERLEAEKKQAEEDQVFTRTHSGYCSLCVDPIEQRRKSNLEALLK